MSAATCRAAARLCSTAGQASLQWTARLTDQEMVAASEEDRCVFLKDKLVAAYPVIVEAIDRPTETSLRD